MESGTDTEHGFVGAGADCIQLATSEGGRGIEVMIERTSVAHSMVPPLPVVEGAAWRAMKSAPPRAAMIAGCMTSAEAKVARRVAKRAWECMVAVCLLPWFGEVGLGVYKV